MKQVSTAIFIIFLSVVGIFVLASAFIVDETEQAVITEFGKPVGHPIQKAGLYWKTPFVQEVHKFDNRILEWDGYPSEIPTADKKLIYVDVTGRWRIDNPLLFLQTMHNERNAQSRLDDIVDGITRDFVTLFLLPEIVRSTNRIMDLKSEYNEEMMKEEAFEKIEIGRDAITRKILDKARGVVKEYGIELIDLRIKRVKYNESVQRKVFERMISERKRAAEQLRSEGQGIVAEIQGKKDKELKRITSEAYKEAQKIRGKADDNGASVRLRGGGRKGSSRESSP